MLEQGEAGVQPRSRPEFAFARGVRVFDTAKVYGTEPISRSGSSGPTIRKQIVLVTKDMPRSPPTC